MSELNELEILASKYPSRKYSKRLNPVDEIEGEIWKSIPKTNDIYHVSNLGRIKKEIMLTSGKLVIGLMKPAIVNGRLTIGLTIRPKYIVKTYVGQLVLATFRPQPGQERLYVKYLDKNVTNCKLENLEWSSANPTMHFAPKLKTKQYLNRRGKVAWKQVQFSEKDLEKMKELSSKGINQNKIAEIFNCSQSYVSKIVNQQPQ